MAIQTGAGTVISIGPADISADNATAYAALDPYEAIGEMVNYGDHGDDTQVVKIQPIGTARPSKSFGSTDPGNITFEYAFDGADAGQSALLAAEAARAEYAFKMAYGDTGGSTPTITYFRGLVLSVTRKGSSSDDAVMRVATIEVNSKYVDVAAT